jgi:predicted SAM-dependent methyltransferase
VAVELGVLKLNLGAGEYPLEGFVNVDTLAFRGIDAVIAVPPLPWPDGSVSEIYMGHFLEHLDFATGAELLVESFRVLAPGGGIGVVVPDFHEIAYRYILRSHAPFEWQSGTHDVTDLDELCHYLLFSTCQPSHHRWAYDLSTLGRALVRAGFVITGEIDRLHDPRLSTPRWYQCGLNARKA